MDVDEKQQTSDFYVAGSYECVQVDVDLGFQVWYWIMFDLNWSRLLGHGGGMHSTKSHSVLNYRFPLLAVL